MNRREEGKPDEVTARLSRDEVTSSRELTRGAGSAGDDEAATGIRPGTSGRDEVPERFRIDQVVAGRFRIIAFIGRGGMGEVYEAQDNELGERVALKTLRLGREEAARAIERFRREILLARRVTHPNVCRIFDVFRHEDETGGVVLLLSMELLAGETLGERLRNGRVSPAAALPIVRHMGAALAAAHEAGIVHRDFKPDNVMLVPSGKGDRAVVMDFGVAHGSLAGGEEALTGTGEVLGTLAYMAPEQVEGRPVSPATDIYALGVVLYEMVTGKRPFAGESPLASAVMRLKQLPPSPRTEVPDLDENWEKAILKCLEREPGMRFSSAAELVDSLETPPDARAKESSQVKRIVAAAVGAALLLGAGVFLLSRGDVSPGAPDDSVETRRAVAVVGFKNLTSDPQSAWLSTALSEMLTTELAASEKLRVIPGELVARMKSDLDLPEADSFASDTLERIRTSAGAHLVVLGAYTALGEPGRRQIRLDLKLQDTAAGGTLASLQETGTESELFALVSGLGSSLRGKLALGERSEAEARAVRASLPATPEATQAYSEGLERLRVFDYLGARARLKEATTLDPDYPLAHAALAEVWYQLNYERNAVEEAKKAFELSRNLTREERLFIEARYREVSLERETAIDLYRMLWDFFPDNVDYGLNLARLQFEVFDRRRSSQTTLAALKRIPGSEEDPRIDLAEVELAWWDDDPDARDIAQVIATARKAADKARARGARSVEARARLEEGYYLEELPEALAAYEKARLLFEDAGDGVGAVRALRAAAERLQEENEFDRARGVLEEAMRTAQAIGAEPTAGEVLVSLASVHIAEGDLDKALSYQEEALELFRRLDSLSWIARANFERAHILRTRGRTEEAEKLFQESLETCRVMSQGPCIYEALSGMALIFMERDELGRAEAALEEAVAHATRIDYEKAVLEARVTRAFVLLEDGRAAEAETQLRRLLEGGRGGYAELALARALLVQGEVAQARKVSDLARESYADRRFDWVPDYERVLRSRITSARVAEEVMPLEAIIGESRRLGLLNVELEARLAKAEIEKNPAALGVVEREARENGYLLLARKAAEARRP
jgi:serine/threonine protein kinase/tetratricopeptide (TPR) repeat protein/TolB-like protein